MKAHGAGASTAPQRELEWMNLNARPLLLHHPLPCSKNYGPILLLRAMRSGYGRGRQLAPCFALSVDLLMQSLGVSSTVPSDS